MKDSNCTELTIDDLKLSNRTYNCLKRNGLTNLSVLCKMTFADFLNVSSMGKKSAQEIFHICEQINLYQNNDGRIQCKCGSFVTEYFLKFSKFVKLEKLYFNVRALNALRTLNAITLFDVLDIDLYKIQNIGRGTIKLIQEELNRYIDLVENANFDGNYIEQSLSKMPFYTIKGYDETIYSNDYDMTIENVFQKFISDLDFIKEFDSIEKYNTFNLFLNIKSFSNIDINSKIKNVLSDNKLNDREIDIYLRRGYGETLEEISHTYHVERERIRQIDKKNVLKMKSIFNNERVLTYLKNSNVLNLSLNESFLDDDLYRLFVLRIDELSDYRKFVDDNKIIQANKNYVNSIQSYLLELKQILDIKGIIEESNTRVNEYNETILNALLKELDLVRSDNKISIKSTKREKMALYIKDKVILDLTKKNIKNEIKEFNEKFGTDIDSERAFIGLVIDVAFSIGGGKYTSKENEPIVTDEILESIINEIQSKKFVKADVLYNKYNQFIENLLSPTHLYLYLKEHFYDSFNFGGTNLVISTLDTECSNAARAYSMLKNNDGPIDRDKLMLTLGIDTIRINIIDSQNEDIFKYGRQKYYLKSKLLMDKNSEDKIKLFLDKTNMFLAKDLLSYCLINGLEIIKNNFINDSYEFISFCLNCNSNIFECYSFNKDTNMFERKTDSKIENLDLEFEL